MVLSRGLTGAVIETTMTTKGCVLAEAMGSNENSVLGKLTLFFSLYIHKLASESLRFFYVDKDNNACN